MARGTLEPIGGVSANFTGSIGLSAAKTQTRYFFFITEGKPKQIGLYIESEDPVEGKKGDFFKFDIEKIKIGEGQQAREKRVAKNPIKD